MVYYRGNHLIIGTTPVKEILSIKIIRLLKEEIVRGFTLFWPKTDILLLVKVKEYV